MIIGGEMSQADGTGHLADPEMLPLSQKIALLAGADLWHTADLSPWGLAAVRMTDGPNGARGHSFDGESSTCFPVGTALAATWDLDLMAIVGQALAVEARRKGAHLLLAPTVNLHRHPLAGRNFECYSEDPWLTAAMASAYISGLQSGGVGACIKHFVGNESEYERHTMSSDIDERTLHECYLLPFEYAVRTAQPWAVMTAYNRVNGIAASDHHHLISNVLRGSWGFTGTVVSDWGGTRSTVEALVAGVDIEMPGPAQMRGDRLERAAAEGKIELAHIDRGARQVWQLLQQATTASATNLPVVDPDQVAARAARQSMVLLTNDGLLPMRAGAGNIAVIGPNAAPGQIQGGGSSRVRPRHHISPLDGIRSLFGPDHVIHAQGCRIDRYRTPVTRRHLTHEVDGHRTAGALLELFASADPVGTPVSVSSVRGLSQTFYGLLEGIDPGTAFSARLTATFQPEVSGTHQLGVAAAGRAEVWLDGSAVISVDSALGRAETFYGLGTAEFSIPVELVAGIDVQIVVEFRSSGDEVMSGLMMGLSAPESTDLLQEAVACAASCEVAVVVVGLDSAWETEGVDRVSMALPGEQNRLIREVAAANPRTVVIVNAGSPVEMPWRDEVAVIIQAWYPGQEFGAALADILSGRFSPEGRLPTTFPQRLEDTPAAANYPGDQGHVAYHEGIHIGYRHYHRAGITPLFPFGHGLTYTSFSYGEPTVQSGVEDNDPWTVDVPVTNIGDRDGVEVVQVYASWPESTLERPARTLVGWSRVEVACGALVTATVKLDPWRLAYWDTNRGQWVCEPGRVCLHIGTSSTDERGRAEIFVS
jgi:beta-glucosidase